MNSEGTEVIFSFFAHPTKQKQELLEQGFTEEQIEGVVKDVLRPDFLSEEVWKDSLDKYLLCFRGMTYVAAAQQYGVSPSAIRRAVVRVGSPLFKTLNNVSYAVAKPEVQDEPTSDELQFRGAVDNRTYNSLIREGIKTFTQLEDYVRNDWSRLFDIRGLGKNGIRLLCGGYAAWKKAKEVQ